MTVPKEVKPHYDRIIEIVNDSNMTQEQSDDLMAEVGNIINAMTRRESATPVYAETPSNDILGSWWVNIAEDGIHADQNGQVCQVTAYNNAPGLNGEGDIVLRYANGDTHYGKVRRFVPGETHRRTLRRG